MKWIDALEKSKNFWFLIVASFIFFLLRLPSLFEPYWYGDEGIYQTIGLALNNGRNLYTQIWDNKPPLLYLLYSILGSDQFLIRLVSLFFGLFSVIVFLFVAKRLFSEKVNSQKAVFVSTSVFAFLFSIPLLEGNIANAENFMLLPILLASVFILSHSDKKPKNLYIAGLLISIAFLFKVVAIFDFATFIVFVFFLQYTNRAISISNIIKTAKEVIPLIIVFIIPIILVASYFVIQGSFLDFYQGTFTQMVSYVAYGNTFLFPQGFLVIKLLLLSLFLFFLFTKRASIPKSSLFILIWLAFSLFNSFFAERPYTHYLLVLLPSFSLLLGQIIATQKQSFQKAGICLFIVLTIIIVNNFNLYLKTYPYYKNFISFLTHQKNVYSYYAFFDSKTPQDYEIAAFLKMHLKESDNIYIWGNNAQVYKMVNKLPPGRFTVAYHATARKENSEETKKAVEKAKPRYILITSPNSPYPFSLMNYAARITIGESIIYERLY